MKRMKGFRIFGLVVLALAGCQTSRPPVGGHIEPQRLDLHPGLLQSLNNELNREVMLQRYWGCMVARDEYPHPALKKAYQDLLRAEAQWLKQLRADLREYATLPNFSTRQRLLDHVNKTTSLDKAAAVAYAGYSFYSQTAFLNAIQPNPSKPPCGDPLPPPRYGQQGDPSVDSVAATQLRNDRFFVPFSRWLQVSYASSDFSARGEIVATISQAQKSFLMR